MKRLAPLFALALGACVSVLPKAPPAPNLFTIEAAPGQPAAESKPLVLSVQSPRTPRSIGGADLVWRQGAEIQYVPGTAWEGDAPDLLTRALVDTIRAERGVAAAVQGGGVKADVELRWDVGDFSVHEESGQTQAVFDADAMLVDMTSRRVVGERRFHAEAPLPMRSGRGAATGLAAAAQDGLRQISAWAAQIAQPSAASTSR